MFFAYTIHRKSLWINFKRKLTVPFVFALELIPKCFLGIVCAKNIIN